MFYILYWLGVLIFASSYCFGFNLNLIVSERPKLYTILALLIAVGLKDYQFKAFLIVHLIVLHNCTLFIIHT